MKRFRVSRRIRPRFIIGLILVVVSVAGVVGVVRMASHESEAVVSTRLLVEGHQIVAADLRSAPAGLRALPGLYQENAEQVIGKVVTRAITAGELIPTASIGNPAEVIETTLVINVDTPLPSGISPGSLIDVWAATPAVGTSSRTETTAQPAQRLIRRARLASHQTPAGNVMTSGERVEIVVSREDVAVVLDAQSAGLSFYVVSTSGGLL